MTPDEQRAAWRARSRKRRASLSPEQKAERAARRREQERAARAADPARNIERTRAWVGANRDTKRASTRASYDKHAEKRRAEALARYHANRDEILAKRKAWREANPEKCRAVNHHRRQHGRGQLPDGAWEQIVRNFNGACAYCHQQSDHLEFEHMQPLSRGGLTTVDNVVPACPTCNRRKKTRNILEFWPFT